MKRILIKLKEKTGLSTFIETPISMLLILMVVLVLLDLYPPIIKRINLNTFSRELVREIEIYGNIGSEATERIEELEKSLSISPTISYNKRGTLTLNEDFEITLEYSMKTPFFKIPFDFVVVANGKSEIYRK